MTAWFLTFYTGGQNCWQNFHVFYIWTHCKRYWNKQSYSDGPLPPFSMLDTKMLTWKLVECFKFQHWKRGKGCKGKIALLCRVEHATVFDKKKTWRKKVLPTYFVLECLNSWNASYFFRYLVKILPCAFSCGNGKIYLPKAVQWVFPHERVKQMAQLTISAFIHSFILSFIQSYSIDSQNIQKIFVSESFLSLPDHKSPLMK